MLIRLSPLRDLSRFMNSDGDSVSGKAMLHSGPHTFACSGVILASRSKFIKKCLTGGSNIILPQEIQPEQVIQCLRLLYGGSLELDTTNVASLLKMSIHLEFDELFERCAEWLEGNSMENSAAQLISSTTSKSKLEVANMLANVYSEPDGPMIKSISHQSDPSINPKNSFLLKESAYEKNWQHDTSNNNHINEKPASGLVETDLRFKLQSSRINSNLNKSEADSGNWRHDKFEDYLDDTAPVLRHATMSKIGNTKPKDGKKWNLDVFKNQPSLHRLSTEVTEHDTSDSLSFRSRMKSDHELTVKLDNRRVDVNVKKSTAVNDKWQHDKFTGDHADSNASQFWSHDAKSTSENTKPKVENKWNLDVFKNQPSLHRLSTEVTEHDTSDSASFRSRMRSDHEVTARKVDMNSIENWQHDKRDTDDSIVESLDNLKIPIEPTVPFKPNDLSCWESFSPTDILKLCSKSCHLPEFAKMEVVLGWIVKQKIPNKQEALDKILCNIDPLKLSDRYISILNESLSNTSNLLLPSNFDSHITFTHREESGKSQCELIAHQWPVNPTDEHKYLTALKSLKSGYLTAFASCHLCPSPHQAITLKLVIDTPCYEIKEVPPLAVISKHFHPGSVCHWLMKTDVVDTNTYKLMSLITTPYKHVVKAIHQPNANLAIICLQKRSVQ